MRFISQIRKYGVQIRPIRTMLLATGQEQTLTEPIYVNFREGDITSHEVEYARSHFSLRGFKTEIDEVTEVNPITRLSSFDTDLEAELQNWDAETKALVEEELKKIAANDNSDVLYVTPTPVPIPWPRYDEFDGTPEAVVQKLREDGHELSIALRYERQNQNRPEITTALEEALVVDEISEADREFVGA